MKKFVGFYNYTVILTYIGLAAAVTGCFFAAGGELVAAIFCLLIAGISDMFDGKIARTMERTRQEKDFGIQIDSLCDVISFGVLPAMMSWAVGLRGWPAMAVGVIYVLCGLIRLAYYNVTENDRQRQTEGKREDYLGMPISTVGLLVPLVCCLSKPLGAAFPPVYAGALLLFAFLFICPLRIKKPGMRGMIIMIALGVAALAVICVTLLQ